MTRIPTLETERLILRGWQNSDFDGYAALMADTRSHFVGGPLLPEDAWRKMSGIAGHWLLLGYGTFALELKSERAFIGYCGPWYPYGFPEPEIGWALSAGAEGKGYVTEAARAALAYAFRDLGWRTAVSFIAPENTPSVRVAERLKARFESTTVIRGKPAQVWRHENPNVPGAI